MSWESEEGEAQWAEALAEGKITLKELDVPTGMRYPWRSEMTTTVSTHQTTKTTFLLKAHGKSFGELVSTKVEDDYQGDTRVKIDFQAHRTQGGLSLDQAAALRDALTEVIGDYRSYDPEVWEPDTSCPHRIPCGSPCQTGRKLVKRA